MPHDCLKNALQRGGGGFNPKKPKKPKISLKSHFGCWVFLGFLGFNWIFLRTFKKNVMKVFFAHCNVTLVDFERYFSPFKICLG